MDRSILPTFVNLLLFSISFSCDGIEFESKRPLTNKNMFSLDAMGNTLEAARVLIQNKIHRLPLIDKQEAPEDTPARENVIGVITQFKILRFLSTNVRPPFSSFLDSVHTQWIANDDFPPLSKLQLTERPSFFKKSVKELGFGTYENIKTAMMETPLIEVLDLMTKFRITVVPIVDSHGPLFPYPLLFFP